MAKNHITCKRGEAFFTPLGKMRVKEEPVTPFDEDFGDHNHLAEYDDGGNGGMRKSLSMSDIAALREELLSLELEVNKEDVYQRYRRPATPKELSKTKFVSMAEAIYHYERDTPGRFHSLKAQNFRPTTFTASELTVPQSPMLRCKTRARTLHVMSQKEKEEMEIEELKKYKIKANPIPKSVLEGPKHLPEIQKKPITVPEPFKLTEIQKKAVESPDHITFKARPAPRHILEKPHIPPKPPVQVTKAITPKFHYKRTNSADALRSDSKPANFARQRSAEKPAVKSIRHGPLRAVPFSFEKRDEEMKRRKEERIKQQIEEERKQATLFKAQPLPGAVKRAMSKVTIKGSMSNASSENKENHVKFEAKAPSVLYKEPFKPVLQQTHIVKPKPFALTTEKRAADREKFDKLLKSKEEEMEKIRQQKEKEKQEEEDRMRTKLREKLVHHPKPMSVTITKPFVPEKSSAPITVPETPKFVRRLKQH